jgi:hypothetical protein
MYWESLYTYMSSELDKTSEYPDCYIFISPRAMQGIYETPNFSAFKFVRLLVVELTDNPPPGV